ncbi:protein PET100 homolog, mitochondrial isoform X1 [Nomascus leucogenys]|uniref:protein PET100 homolog, mitochondrial isoform X1 n=1 Tax=Nomascus leucogenys TaxID=61853 RepID=UPI00122DA468|nr:protein PET100 homolog, mitochondrial isoform X1 [Nomascus leucogenys]XP_032025371.1 protein PET100 homolog, mitochondrial isoform X1 [Hylobates moloch]
MGVKLEIFRVSGHRSGLGGLAGDLPGSEDEMIIYLTFPVAMFWVSNQAEWFEDHVIQRKRELWPPEKLQEIEEFKERLRKRREEKLLRDAQQNS